LASSRKSWQAWRMVRGIIVGLLTLAVMLLITFGVDAFLDGVPEPWHTLRWALFMGGLFFITWRMQRAGIIGRDPDDDQQQAPPAKRSPKPGWLQRHGMR
jgi:hypothetical protein